MLDNLKKIEFKRGNSVKIKEGIIHPELNLELKDWEGRVFEVYEDAIDLELDSITLRNLSNEYLDHYGKKDEYPHIINVPKTDLASSEPRDDYDEVEKVQDEIIEKLDSLPRNDIELPYQTLHRKWVRHFQRSRYYGRMGKSERTKSDFILGSFSDYMYDYEGQLPAKWTAKALERVCLELVPKRITAEKELFEAYGEVLIHYFEFLESRRYLETKSLQDSIQKIKAQIIEKSQNSSNWGMAKSFMMGAKAAGVDLYNKEAMDKYLMEEQLRRQLGIKEDEQKGKLGNNFESNKFQSLGRNEKITVEYIGGKILKDVKVKKVIQDLQRGICKIKE